MNATARRLFRSVRAARASFAACGLLGFLTAIAIVAQAALLARVVAEVFLDHTPLAELQGTLIALVGIACIRAALAGGFEVTGRLGAQRVMSGLRRDLVHRLLEDRPSAAADERSGELAAAAVQGVDALEVYFARYLPQVILTALVPLAILIYAVQADFAAAMILLLTAPLIPIFMILIGRSAEAATRSRWQTLSLMSAHFLDIVRGLPTLRAYNRADAQQETVERVGERFRDETMQTLRIAFLSALVLELLAMIGTALVAAVVGVQLVNGSLGFEAGLAVLILAPELYQPFRQVGAQYHASTEGVAAAERIFEVLDMPSAVSTPATPRRAPSPANARVRFEDVTFTYPGRDRPVLEGASFEIAPRETVALVGSSGEGKSTVAALLARMLDPDSGRITCGEVDLQDVDPRDWRDQVAWVPQRPHLFATSLRENLLLGAPAGTTDAELAEAIESVGLTDLVASLPQGLATRVGDGGRPLSFGESQRVGLVRAWMREAPLLVLDEATAYLDPESSERVKLAIELLAQSRSVLLITHSADLAGIANRTLRLTERRVFDESQASTGGRISERSSRRRFETSVRAIGATA